MLETEGFTIIYFEVGIFILNIFHKDAYHYLSVMRLAWTNKSKEIVS